MHQITVAVLERRKKNTDASDACVIDLMKKYENLIGKLDAVLAQLTIIDPSKDKIGELEQMKIYSCHCGGIWAFQSPQKLI